MSPPRQNPGKSRQDYETPPEFIKAIESRWGPIDWDLACRRDNCKSQTQLGYFFPEVDALKQPWAIELRDMNVWLNPEFADIEPWAAKCALEGPAMRRGRIFMLTPAAVGSNWYHDHVKGKAMVLALRSRIQFVGTTAGYPKDLVLSVFAPGMVGFDDWDWKGNKR